MTVYLVGSHSPPDFRLFPGPGGGNKVGLTVESTKDVIIKDTLK